MPEDVWNIYKICREQAGYTQERAAELLGCSVRALARYESGGTLVPDPAAYRMIQLYNSHYLGMEHLRLVSQVAAELLPRWRPARSRPRRYACSTAWRIL